MAAELQIGMIGLDSSHAVEFAKLWHDHTHPLHVPGARVVVAYPGGSADWALSYQRVDGFTAQIRDEFGVCIAATIDEVVAKVDAVMVLSIDGRVHPGQLDAVVAAGKPVFIDKPLALSAGKVDRMQRVAAAKGARIWSASSWRFAAGLRGALSELGGPCEEATVGGPWPLFEGLHGWAFYGMHHIELLYAAMGVGCLTVSCIQEGATETLTGHWTDGRRGVITATHDQEGEFWGKFSRPGRTVEMEVTDTLRARYAALMREVVAFCRGGEAPVSAVETRETIAFLAAAWRSRGEAGERVELETTG